MGPHIWSVCAEEGSSFYHKLGIESPIPQLSTVAVEVFWLLNFIVFHRVCYIGVNCGSVLWILL